MIDTDVLDTGLGDEDDDDFDEMVEVGDAQLPEHRYMDRELSWLAFNQRVLELAEDPSLPVLERANFLAIFASNLDEFFMVRVAGLKRRIVTGSRCRRTSVAPPGRPRRHLRGRAHAAASSGEGLARLVQPALADAGIEVVSWDDLSDDDRKNLYDYFQSQVFPVLMPLAVDPAHPSPTSPASR
jgi:polyphosphate kinase